MKIKYSNLFYVSILMAFTFTFSYGAYAQGFLKASDGKIVNEKGENVLLRGMGLGGWMLQEGYMFKVPNLGRQYRIKEEISKLVGTAKADEFYQRWLKYHTTKTDIDSLASWGFNSVRLPMHYALYTLPVDQEPIAGKNTWLKTGFDLTDSLLEWCKANKMYLILDLHAAPGGQGNDLNISDRNPAKPSIWESRDNQLKTIALWRKLAEHYKNEPWIGGYDIINEPNWGFQDSSDFRGTEEKLNIPLRKLMVEITEEIRKVDQKHIIIIEGNGFGNNYRGIFPKWDNNLVLSFHKYGNFNTTGAIQQFINYREKENIPIWLGESGENSNTWFTEAIQLAEDHNIGWAWWQLKKIGINNPLEIKLSPDYQQLIQYWNGKAGKPSEAVAWKTLSDFVDHTKIENNIYHPDVIDAMFRQVQQKTAKPFVTIPIHKGSTLSAVDFDLGPQGIAYQDADTASYHYTPGVNTRGNRGSSYRNDGVDIKKNENGSPYIFSIEDGEWLQYTIQVPEGGTYQIDAKVTAPSKGELQLVANNHKKNVLINAASNSGWETLPIGSFELKKGENIIKLLAVKGGFDLLSLSFN